jgi:hypothetical protein
MLGDALHLIVAGVLFGYPLLQEEHIHKTYDTENRK